jgi:hypothetical protein
MLKQIPNENPDQIRARVAKKARRFIAAGPGFSSNRVISMKMNQKKEEEKKKDHGIVKSVCIKLIQFVQGGEKSHQQVTEMIHGLQRSVLSLERQRNRIIRQSKNRKGK